MFILGIDPGPELSGFAIVSLDGPRVVASGRSSNYELLDRIKDAGELAQYLAIEALGYQGEHVGRSVFMTAEWIGRFKQRFLDSGGFIERYSAIERADVAMHFAARGAKKSAVHDAVRCRFYPTGELTKVKGTKKAPGPCYGVSGDHAWDGVSVAIAAAERAGLLPRSQPREATPAIDASP